MGYEARAFQSIDQMRNNSLLGALSSAGTMGVGERKKVTNHQDVKVTSDPIAKAVKGNHSKAASSKSVSQNVGKSHSYQSLSTSSASQAQALSKNNQNPLIGIAILCSIVGAV